MKRFQHALVFCVIAFILTGTAHAQLFQTRVERFSSGSNGAFDYYVLALSWSPSFCAETGEKRGSEQCGIGRNIGFTVHGLWPQLTSGYPSNCPTSEKFVPRNIIDGVRDLFPDEKLARYQWRKHGSCSGLDPASYFKDTRIAARKVRFPDLLRNSRQPVTMQPIDIERAFAAINPGLRPEMMRVMCRRGQLQEVRVCFDKSLRGFIDCGRLQRSDCGFTGVRINPPR